MRHCIYSLTAGSVTVGCVTVYSLTVVWVTAGCVTVYSLTVVCVTVDRLRHCMLVDSASLHVDDTMCSLTAVGCVTVGCVTEWSLTLFVCSLAVSIDCVTDV